jgi:hypothetical protein
MTRVQQGNDVVQLVKCEELAMFSFHRIACRLTTTTPWGVLMLSVYCVAH